MTDSASQDQQDHYELLELSPSASFETIERMFRYHAKKYHPDTPGTGDSDKFKRILDAYHVLRDPAKRSAYDSLYEQRKLDNHNLATQSNATSDDYAIRYRLLTLFYAQRRRNMNQPGIGIAKLEEVTGLPTEIIEFHLWYFREKGWVQRELSGPLSITYAGVDEIESREKARAESIDLRIGYGNQKSRINDDSMVTQFAT